MNTKLIEFAGILALTFILGGCATAYSPKAVSQHHLATIEGSKIEQEGISAGFFGIELIDNKEARSAFNLSNMKSPLKIDAGPHDLLIICRFGRSFLGNSYVTYVPMRATFRKGGLYTIKGEVNNDRVTVWIEDRYANELITKKVTARASVVGQDVVVPVFL